MKHKFKVGDRVEVIAECHEGEEGVISKMDNTGCPYYVKLDNRGYVWKLESNLKLITSTVNQRIEQLEKELADLKESVRPKKKIEFVCWVMTKSKKIESTVLTPSVFENVALLHKGINGELDLMKAWKDHESDAHIYLGHFNDGIK